MMAIGRLRRRSEFLRVAAAKRKWVARHVIVQHAPAPEHMIRYGLTASKKVGNAPTRNRARRRLRAAARLMFPGRGVPADIVLIARQSIATASWGEILDDIRHALEKLERGIAMNNGQA